MSERSSHPFDDATHPILGDTRVVGLIGWPVEHSVSPPMHNAAFRELALPWCYVPLPVRPKQVREALFGARALGLIGFNVTVPHKQAIHDLVDERTPAAQVIGAVNTVIFEGHRIIGHNTDAGGFLRALGEAGVSPTGCSALVLGAGGAARAVVYALGSVGAQVTILNRTAQRATDLALEFSSSLPQAHLEGGALNCATLDAVAAGADLVVNTTPLGMWPKVEASSWPKELPFPPNAFCYDLVYNPRETRLIQQAREAGARASDGLGMLVYQGAEAFERWTGQEAPVNVMYAACTDVLGRE